MARTHGEKIDELSRLVAALAERLDYVRAEVARIDSVCKEITRELKELAIRFAVLEHQVAELRKSSEEGSRRRWAFLPPLAAALAGGTLALLGNAALTYLRKGP